MVNKNLFICYLYYSSALNRCANFNSRPNNKQYTS